MVGPLGIAKEPPAARTCVRLLVTALLSLPGCLKDKSRGEPCSEVRLEQREPLVRWVDAEDGSALFTSRDIGVLGETADGDHPVPIEWP